MKITRVWFLLGVLALAVSPAAAQGSDAPTEVTLAAAVSDAEGLAKKLANPVASLISVPFQLNWDFGVGPEDGHRFIMNFQPVLPFKLSADWNLITRVIVPVIAQPVLTPGGESTSGMGDLVLSGFFSPAKGGLIWGVGPVFALPVTSDPALGTGKFGLGPTFVVLKQFGPWTTGALANHLWSVAGDRGRAGVSQTFVQPFLSYTTSSALTFSLSSETTYNWKADDEPWTVPINLQLSKLLTLGGKPISVGAGVRYYPEAPSGGPDWGLRLQMVLLFPTGA